LKFGVGGALDASSGIVDDITASVMGLEDIIVVKAHATGGGVVELGAVAGGNLEDLGRGCSGIEYGDHVGGVGAMSGGVENILMVKARSAGLEVVFDQDCSVVGGENIGNQTVFQIVSNGLG
jgi:hypothetical protein